jgi:hypothetical protein
VHEPKLLLPTHIASMGPLRLTTPSRTLFDLAPVLHIGRLRRTTDDVLAKRLSNVRALHEMLKVLARRGRSGIANMRIVLEERPIGYRPPESHLESRVQQILRGAGLHGFERRSGCGRTRSRASPIAPVDASPSSPAEPSLLTGSGHASSTQA